MSKERELLKQVVENFAYVQDMHLIVAIQKLLNQPEHTEQEPVAWMNDSGGCFLSDGNKYSENWIALYTAPPKREPIDTRRITLKMFSEGVDMQYKNGYVDGIRFAEKMHSIGGGE